MRTILTTSVLALLFGCANPLNEATAMRYSAECGAAESAGNLALADQLCYRAVKNADWGNLSQELKSQHLYNFARIKRRLAKFGEAEEILKASLAIEEPLSGSSSLKVGRRLVELSVNLAAQKKWDEGQEVILRVLPIAPGFTGSERNYTKEVYLNYATTMQELARSEVAGRLRAAAAAL
jgi:hypothetical protein